MKEATGEANMTVVTIILISVIVAIATPLVKNMMSNTKDRSECMNNGGYWENGQCTGADVTAGGNAGANS